MCCLLQRLNWLILIDLNWRNPRRSSFLYFHLTTFEASYFQLTKKKSNWYKQCVCFSTNLRFCKYNIPRNLETRWILIWLSHNILFDASYLSGIAYTRCLFLITNLLLTDKNSNNFLIIPIWKHQINMDEICAMEYTV